MNQTTTEKPIERPLLARINRVAHARALQHEGRIKADLLARLQAAKNSGVPSSAMYDMLSRMETAPIS